MMSNEKDNEEEIKEGAELLPKSITYASTYKMPEFLGHMPTSGLFKATNLGPIKVDNQPPLTVTVHHTIKSPTEAENRAYEEMIRGIRLKLTPKIVPTIKEFVSKVKNPPFITTEEICEALHTEHDDMVYQICEELEGKGILESRRFYDDDGYGSEEVWWIRKKKRNDRK